MGKAGMGSDVRPACRGQDTTGITNPHPARGSECTAQGQMFTDISEHKYLKIRGYFQCATRMTTFL